MFSKWCQKLFLRVKKWKRGDENKKCNGNNGNMKEGFISRQDRNFDRPVANVWIIPFLFWIDIKNKFDSNKIAAAKSYPRLNDTCFPCFTNPLSYLFICLQGTWPSSTYQYSNQISLLYLGERFITRTSLRISIQGFNNVRNFLLHEGHHIFNFIKAQSFLTSKKFLRHFAPKIFSKRLAAEKTSSKRLQGIFINWEQRIMLNQSKPHEH